MLQLLNPIWLFGIGGIIIPLLIHLWNVKTGKTFKVGSIQLMGESSRQNSRSLRLLDLLLLFLRCLMIILVSTLLAEPVWRSTEKVEENQAWVLVEKDAFTETYSNFKTEIDSLLIAGNELHFFEPEFRKTELDEILKDSVSADSSPKLSYWSLLKLMEQDLPRGSKAYIFTGNRQNRVAGNRPSSNKILKWKTYTPSDSTSKWVDHAYTSAAGDIRAIVSESTAGKTIRSIVKVDPDNTNTALRSTVVDGRLRVQLEGQTLAVDTSTIRIAINADGFPNDAEYIRAAIGAIQKYTARKIKFVHPSTEMDILFWLSPKAPPALIAEKISSNGIIFQYAGGKEIETNSWIGGTGMGPYTEQIQLQKRIIYSNKEQGTSVWEDGFGDPILHYNKKNNINVYTFYTRLNPAWSDLVWSPDFVNLLMPLILPKSSDHYQHLDRRSIEPIQLTPSPFLVPQTSDIRPLTSDLRRLTSALWLLLISTLLIERIISFRSKQT